MKNIFIGIIIALTCSGFIGSDHQNHASAQRKTRETFAGEYVSSDYERRGKGYDWTAVIVTETSDTTAHILVRSRADKKRPTCTLDLDAVLVNDSTLRGRAGHVALLFSFNSRSITVKAERSEDEGLLSYFCSGGASLGGTYKRLQNSMDRRQIDKRTFQSVLTWGYFFCDISATRNELTVTTVGLTADNQKWVQKVNGVITGAEIGDLNIDGHPEVLVYCSSADSSRKGSIIGFSVNNGKSMSMIAFPELSSDSSASKEYAGFDEFAIVESSLARRFRTYRTIDGKLVPTGMYRQIQYILKDGESSRKFVINNIVEFATQ